MDMNFGNKLFDPFNTTSSPRHFPFSSMDTHDMIPLYSPRTNFSPQGENEYFNSLFTVKWSPSINGFFEFIKKYREIMGIELGGTRKSRYKYTDPTVSKVLSVGLDDDLSSLPQRVSLSNFNIGPPIASYGCIYRYQGENEPEYLLIRRCDSVSYIDLIRSNYRESQLFFMIGELPNIERKRLMEYDFDVLWYDLHRKPAEGEIYDFAKEAFRKISPHFQTLFDLIPSNDPEGTYSWLFPKGKPDYTSIDDGKDVKMIPESPFASALREFTEETNGLNVIEEDLLLQDPLVERFLGSNSKNYQTTYFVFGTDNRPEISPLEYISTNIREVSTAEVSEICWVPLSQIDRYLRPARQDLIRHIERKLTETDYVQPVRVRSIWKSPAEINDLLPENEY